MEGENVFMHVPRSVCVWMSVYVYMCICVDALMFMYVGM